MKIDYEVLNYLNLTNPRLGKRYKLTGKNPLPKSFVFSNKLIEDKLYLNQMVDLFKIPTFVFDDKKNVKQHFKYSVENLKKLKSTFTAESKTHTNSNTFVQKLIYYFKIRITITKIILREFRNIDFNEKTAYKEIFSIDPILGDLLIDLFEKDCNINEMFKNLENKYNNLFNEKLKLLK